MYCTLKRRIVLGVLHIMLVGCDHEAPSSPRTAQAIGNQMPVLTAVSPSRDTTRMRVGERLALPFPSVLSRSRDFSWASNNPDVVGVNSSGLVRAMGEGFARITASSSGVNQTYAVTVTQPSASITGFALSPVSGIALSPGATMQFTARVYWSDGTERSQDVTYQLPQGGGVITQNGLFTAGAAAGTFLAVANCVCGFSASATVEIRLPSQLEKLTIAPKSVTLTPGSARQFVVSAHWRTGATEVPPVTWSSIGGSITQTGVFVAPAQPEVYRVIVAHNGGSARDTAFVTVLGDTPTTQNPGAVLPFFSDGFETGNYGRSNGFVWAAPTRVTVSDDRAYTGKYALKFRFPGSLRGNDAFSEQRFDFGRYTKSIWIEYMLYVPQNFRHRNDLPNNNKFIVLWKDAYGSQSGEWQISWEYRRLNDTASLGELMSSRWDELEVTGGGPWPSPRPPRQVELIGGRGALRIGQWNRVRFMAKAASSRTAEDGESRLWVNETLVLKYTTGRFFGADPVKGDATLRRGYLLGWANSGFDEETVFFLDDIKFYTSDPGWQS